MGMGNIFWDLICKQSWNFILDVSKTQHKFKQDREQCLGLCVGLKRPHVNTLFATWNVEKAQLGAGR